MILNRHHVLAALNRPYPWVDNKVIQDEPFIGYDLTAQRFNGRGYSASTLPLRLVLWGQYKAAEYGATPAQYPNSFWQAHTAPSVSPWVPAYDFDQPTGGLRVITIPVLGEACVRHTRWPGDLLWYGALLRSKVFTSRLPIVVRWQVWWYGPPTSPNTYILRGGGVAVGLRGVLNGQSTLLAVTHGGTEHILGECLFAWAPNLWEYKAVLLNCRLLLQESSATLRINDTEIALPPVNAEVLELLAAEPASGHSNTSLLALGNVSTTIIKDTETWDT